jgi:hypothetical protein
MRFHYQGVLCQVLPNFPFNELLQYLYVISKASNQCLHAKAANKQKNQTAKYKSSLHENQHQEVFSSLYT